MYRVTRELERIVGEGAIPSASVAVRVDGVLALHHTVGRARLVPARDARPDEPYDLASLTKPVVAVVAAAMIEDGTLSLSDPVVRFVAGADPRITIAHLLNHGSGYPAWAPLYALGDTSRAALLAHARRTPLVGVPGAVHCYSDLGFLVLLEVLEAIGGTRIDVLLAPWLARAGLEDLRWGWPGAAATEDCPVRGRIVEGEVHDLNAAALGGISSHAGLFGTARAVAAFGEAVLGPSVLPVCGIARARAVPGPGSHRGGWDTPTPGGSTGRFWPAGTFGHLGYTGTSLWIAPRERVVVALLTNRVHPTDGDRATIRAARQAVHDAVATTLGWDTERR